MQYALSVFPGREMVAVSIKHTAKAAIGKAQPFCLKRTPHPGTVGLSIVRVKIRLKVAEVVETAVEIRAAACTAMRLTDLHWIMIRQCFPGRTAGSSFASSFSVVVRWLNQTCRAGLGMYTGVDISTAAFRPNGNVVPLEHYARSNVLTHR